MCIKQNKQNDEFHVAIIMDGNGRWATNQNKPRFRGHQAGAERVREVVNAAVNLNIDVLTLFAFSSDNWYRPKPEVDFLMNLFGVYLKSEIEQCFKNGIHLSILGRRDRLQPSLVKLIEKTEHKTKNGNKMLLRIAIDYSSREAIITTLKNMNNYENESNDDLYSNISENFRIIDVDFLIRTGGEQRLSDFLLWECAYAELYFTQILWPDFTERCFKDALDDFYSRDRRFGRIPAAIAV
jgi:undecaprenyl diphosphate synthase